MFSVTLVDSKVSLLMSTDLTFVIRDGLSHVLTHALRFVREGSAHVLTHALICTTWIDLF